ncbi:hypothetical protein ASD31_17450 [Rhizobium sp. Root482]|nr:hypothetical protein ASD31_17450 [Rhizobium sp. Root482]
MYSETAANLNAKIGGERLPPLLKFNAVELSSCLADELKSTFSVLGTMVDGGLAIPHSTFTALVSSKMKTRFVQDYLDDLERLNAAICDFGYFRDRRRLQHLQAAAEAHDGGKRTTLLRIAGDEFYYKPRGSGVKRLCEQAIASDARLSKCLATPRVVEYGSRDDYIERAVAHTKQISAVKWDDVGYTFSRLVAVGSSDLHIENIIVGEQKLHLVDVETFVGRNTIINPEDEAFFVSGGTYEGLLKHLILRTLFLPRISFDGSSRIGFINGSTTAELRPTFHRHRDLVNLSEARSIAAPNRGTLSDVDPDAFLSGVADGFNTSAHWVDAVASLVNPTNVAVRLVLRPTRLYATLLAMLHVGSFDTRATRYSFISSKLTGIFPAVNARQRTILDYEATCLSCGYVPTFFQTTGDLSLILGSGQMIDNYFSTYLSEDLVSRGKFMEANSKAAVSFIKQQL